MEKVSANGGETPVEVDDVLDIGEAPAFLGVCDGRLEGNRVKGMRPRYFKLAEDRVRFAVSDIRAYRADSTGLTRAGAALLGFAPRMTSDQLGKALARLDPQSPPSDMAWRMLMDAASSRTSQGE